MEYGTPSEGSLPASEGQPVDEGLPILSSRNATLALVGNPNAGKTSLFNRLTGLHAKTANFAGTTVEHRRGFLSASSDHDEIGLIDLPGMYSLEPTSPEEQVACDFLIGDCQNEPKPEGVIVVVDATNLERNLPLVAEVVALGLPTLVALNMSDLADRLGLKIDERKLSERIGCPVFRISARSGEGIEPLRSAMLQLASTPPPAAASMGCSVGDCHGCGYASRFDWARSVHQETTAGDRNAPSRWTDRLDHVLTHPLGGLIVFAGIMLLTFLAIFSFATVPMDLIEGLFAWAGSVAEQWLPEGDLRSLAVDGVIAGVGGVVVFLPQICLLFFLLALLEDSGYLARAAFVMDRLMQRVGLPGKAFVPLLSAHACAIPAIMASRTIECRRDRLVTILVAPLLSCSARVPVYVMVVAMLFPDQPLAAAALFAGAYLLGIVAALGAAFVLKRTLLPGENRPLVIELPNYRLPSFGGALLETYRRAGMFLKTAGTTILVISLVLWALATYPKSDPTDLPAASPAQLASYQLENSIAGRIGRTLQPVFEPLGFDWKMTVGVVTSFAAREVIVSTLSILYGLGEEGESTTLLDSLRRATGADGLPVFDTPTCLSLLVFFVLAMQCLPTQAVTRAETGSWRWPILQFGYMSVLAYLAALATYQLAHG